jgi:TetR/AcrR family transcriptional regulator, cholesterol catabolism regulator
MQVQKEDIKNDVLKAARKEFLEKGFKGSSMRTIAAEADVTLSNMYNYFTNKDDLFAEVLAPLMDELTRLMRVHEKPEAMDIDIFTSPQYQIDNINGYMKLITRFRKELKLLLFGAHGSRYENFRDSFTDRQTKSGIKYLKAMKRKYPDVNVQISEFFMHTLSSWWLSIIGEIVSHNAGHAKIQTFLAEYMAFSTAGWKKLMNI